MRWKRATPVARFSPVTFPMSATGAARSRRSEEPFLWTTGDTMLLAEQRALDHSGGPYPANLWKSGARFSLKALTPSFDSSVA